MLEDPAVLEGPGLALVGIAAQVDDASLPVDERPFRTHRKIRTAAPAQSGNRHLLRDVVRLHRRQRLGERLVSAAAAIRVERMRVAGRVESEEHAFDAHRRLPKIRSTAASSRFSWYVS